MFYPIKKENALKRLKMCLDPNYQVKDPNGNILSNTPWCTRPGAHAIVRGFQQLRARRCAHV